MNIHVKKPAQSPTVCEGKIDKISLTFSDYTDDQIGFYQSFAIQLCKDGQAKQIYSNKNGYKLNMFFGFANYGDDSNYGGPVILSLFPTKKGMAQMRVEFNPSTLGKVGVETFIYEFGEFFLSDGIDEFYGNARVSRLDIAFDIHGLDINDAHFWSSSLKVSQKYNGKGGRIETLILGSKVGRRLVIYDKAAQMLKTKGITLPGPCTRVEARAQNCGRLVNLPKLNNPLLDFHVSNMKKPKKLDPDLWILFNAYSQLKTQNAALQSLTPKIRGILKDALKSQTLKFWDSESLWSDWPNTVNDSGLFSYFGG